MARRPKSWIIAANILHNWRFRTEEFLRPARVWHGATHRDLSVDDSVRYIRTVFDEYLRHGALSPNDLSGKAVLEIGPGDSIGAALLFLAAGAAKVVCLDRFVTNRDPAQEREIYRALRDTLRDPVETRRFDEAVSLNGNVAPNPARLEVVHGLGIESAPKLFADKTFQLIVSRAVLMEIWNLDHCFRAMDQLLSPAGLMIHKIAPLNDYRMFSQHGYHPLEFLTVPEFLYKQMASSSGKPNRRLRSEYQNSLPSDMYDVQLQPVAFLGAPRGEAGRIPLKTEDEARRQAATLLTEIQPRLHRKFKNAEPEDLMVEDMFLIARKRSQSPSRGAKLREA